MAEMIASESTESGGQDGESLLLLACTRDDALISADEAENLSKRSFNGDDVHHDKHGLDRIIVFVEIEETPGDLIIHERFLRLWQGLFVEHVAEKGEVRHDRAIFPNFVGFFLLWRPSWRLSCASLGTRRQARSAEAS